MITIESLSRTLSLSVTEESLLKATIEGYSDPSRQGTWFRVRNVALAIFNRSYWQCSQTLLKDRLQLLTSVSDTKAAETKASFLLNYLLSVGCYATNAHQAPIPFQKWNQQKLYDFTMEEFMSSPNAPLLQ